MPLNKIDTSWMVIMIRSWMLRIYGAVRTGFPEIKHSNLWIVLLMSGGAGWGKVHYDLWSLLQTWARL